MAKDRAHDDGKSAPRPATPPARTMLVRTPFESDEDNFVPGAPTRLQPAPIHTATKAAAFFDSDEETVTNFATASPAGLIEADPLDDVEIDDEFDAEPASQASEKEVLPVEIKTRAADVVGDDDQGVDSIDDDDAPRVSNPFRDAPTQVDLASVPDDEYAISAENPDDDDTDSHLASIVRAEVAQDNDGLAAFVDEIAQMNPEPDISDLPTAAHATPLIDDGDVGTATPAPLGPPVVKTTATAPVAPPRTEVEDDAPVGVNRWRVVPTGWEAQPSYYSQRVPEPTPARPPQKVHTVMWNVDGEPHADTGVSPSVQSFGEEQTPGRFRDATGANQLAGVYIDDALRALDDLAVHGQGLEPEARRAMHAALFGVAQKLRRAISLLDAERPEGDEPG
jgi:hypothetical protein